MSKPSPTDEQSQILTSARATDDNIMINALAGTGKTTTLEMIETAVKTKPILYVVFSKANQAEAEKRMQSTTLVKTANGLGHGIWAGAVGKKLALNTKKTSDILRALIDEVPRKDQSPFWEVFWDVVQAVGMAKSVGYIPDFKFPQARHLCSRAQFHASLEEIPDDFTADLIDVVLFRSIKAAYAGSIDFNDQIYMPALFGGTYPRFPLVLGDEYQDFNPVNHAMFDRLVRGRLIGVGDPWQNIYAFRGAKPGGMEEAKAKFKMAEKDLSVSFRCPQRIVENARWRVPHFKWLKAGGHVEKLSDLLISDVPSDAIFLCRNNAPLFKAAFNLLAAGRSVSVAGSDIGPKLVAQLRRLGDENTPKATALSLTSAWLDEKLAKGSKTAEDMAECMKTFIRQGEDLGQAIRYAEHLFAQRGTIRLLTGHKSKGLEFDTEEKPGPVYHLDPWLLREDEQDLNLRYVIQTRSANRYYEIDSKRLRKET